MSLTNTQIANNMIALLEKAKKNEALDDYSDTKQLFNKIAKMAIDGKDDRTKLVIKINKELTPYQLFVKENMSSVMSNNPNIPNNERMKIIGSMWREHKDKQPKEPKQPKKPKEV